MTLPFSAHREAPPTAPLVAVNRASPPPLDVWFLHVGDGDCTILRHPDGRFTVVDTHLPKTASRQLAEIVAHAVDCGPLVDFLGEMTARQGRSAEQRLRDDPPKFLRALGAKEVFRLVLTHPDLDHLRGITRLAAEFPVCNLWDTHNLKWLGADEFMSVADGIDWTVYQALRTGIAHASVLRLTAGANGNDWTADGMEILSPTLVEIEAANRTGNWNGISYVLRVVHGASSLILPGDAESWTLERLSRLHGNRLRSTVLKAPHHGRWSCYSEAFTHAVEPALIVVSSGPKARDHDASSMYARTGKVLATEREGTVHVRLHFDGRCEVNTAMKAGDPRIALGLFTDVLRALR